MLNTVKDVMHTIGDETVPFAKKLGADTADFAKKFGVGTADLAKKFGVGTAVFAKQVGARRAIIGVVVIGAVVTGSILLARYLRNRREELPIEATDEHMAAGQQKRQNKRGTDAHLRH
jgi:hypothetical protein